MAGRRPKPTHLKLLHGNPGKRRINEHEPQPPVETPSAPDHLNEAAKTEWERMAELLARLGLLTSLDRAGLAAYCVVYARWVEAEEALKRTGHIVKSPSGYPMVSPYLVVANRSLEQMHKFMVEFRLSPASRSRISINAQSGDDPFERRIQN